MSEIQDDKKPLEGREPLKNIEAPLRDQILENLARKLEDMGWGEKAVTLWNGVNTDRENMSERLKKYRSTWDEFVDVEGTGAFKGASNLHIPMTLTVGKTVHARFLQALIGIDPSFTIKARQEANTERVQMVEEFLRYALNDWANFYKGVEDVLDAWLWAWVMDGEGIMKWRWECQYTTFKDVVEGEEDDGAVYESRNGKPIVHKKKKKVEKEVTITKKTFEGPVLEHIPYEDFAAIGGGGDPDLADITIHRQYVTASDMWTQVDRKVFRKGAVETIIAAGEDRKSGAQGGDAKEQKAQASGQASVDTEVDLDRWELLEVYAKVDVDGNGINSDVIMWVHPATKEIVRATYLWRTNKAGERPFIRIEFHKRHDRAMGLVEMLYPLQVELNAIHNLRIDCGILTTIPFGFYKPTSSIEPEKLEIEPGMLIPVDNPTDVYFPNLGNRTTFGFQEENAIMNIVERLTSISDISLGVMSGQQGAARTATGARALVGEANANLDVFIRRMNRGWRKALRYKLQMLQQRTPEGLEFRVTGDDGKDYFKRVRSREDIAGEYDFELTPNSANSNKAIQQEVANQILQLVLNPIYFQTGVVGPLELYEASKNVLQQIGVKDYGRYIKKPMDGVRQFTPQEEVNRVLLGIPVPVDLANDHQGFLEYFKIIWENDEMLGQFSEQEVMLLVAQAKKHQEMMAAIQQLEAQQANQMQMRMNAMTGQGQSPGMNAMGSAPPAPASGGGAPNGQAPPA